MKRCDKKAIQKERFFLLKKTSDSGDIKMNYFHKIIPMCEITYI